MAVVISTDQTEIDAEMRSFIGRVATGPEYSKDLSFDESQTAMQHILNNTADPVQAGIYLIALRMKRETAEENGGSLQALIESSEIVTAEVDQVVDIAEPYDGYMRGAPVMAFLPVLLAECGVPAVSHGLEEVGPKFGVTHRKVLRAAGANVDLTPLQVAARINNADIAWAYIDQEKFCKPLHDLVPLRKRMVKRPVLTTVEVLVGPIRGKKSTHLVTGYVHKPYPPVYERLAKLAGFESAAIIRGVEGGITPALNKPANYFEYHGAEGELKEINIMPAALGIEQKHRCVPIPQEAQQAVDEAGDAVVDVEKLSAVSAQQGLDALAGAEGPARDCLVYSAAIVLQHVKKVDSLEEGAKLVQQVLSSGQALERFNTH